MKLDEKYWLGHNYCLARLVRRYGIPIYELVRVDPEGTETVLRTCMSEAGILTMLSNYLRGYRQNPND